MICVALFIFFLVGELRRGTQNLRRGTQNLRRGTHNLRRGTQNVRRGTHNLRRGTQNLRRGTQNLLSYHRALYRTLHHQLGSGRNLKSLERGLSVVLHWLCTSGVVYACYAIIFCTCLCISKRMGCCLCMCLSLLLCGRLASRFRHPQLGLELTRVYGCLLYTSPSPRDLSTSRMPSSA